ncbi:MAG: tetratricopeptide repeat protein [Cyanobacteria bacterium P01_F01_bin.13]
MNSTNEPWQQPNPDAESAEFLGLNLEPLNELAVFADFSEGFTVAFAEVNFAQDFEFIITALRQHPRCQDIQFEVLRFADLNLQYLLEEIKTALKQIERDNSKKLVLLLVGTENAIGVIKEYPPFLTDLNFVRDVYPRQVPHPMVFVLPDYAVSRLARYAPDFWSWMSGGFKFRTARQRVEILQTQALRNDRLFTSNTQPVKQERIQQLKSLLTEYAPSGQEIASDKKETCLTIYFELGDAYFSLSDIERAKGFYEKGLALAEELDDRASYADGLVKIGKTLYFLKRSSEALENYETAIEIYRQVGDRLSEANTLKAIGDVQQFLKRSREALENYETAIEIYRQVGDRLGEANTLQALGSLEDDPEAALNAYRTAQAVYEQIGDRYSQGRNLCMFIADAYLALNQTEQAVNSLQTAANIGEEIGFNLLKDYAIQKIQSLQKSNEASE